MNNFRKKIKMMFNQFFFVFLRKNNDFAFTDPSIEKSAYTGHFEFQKMQMLNKKLLFSGPLDGTGGLYFFSTIETSKEDIEKLLQQDPLIKIGLFNAEVHKFFTPAFMMQVLEKEDDVIINFFNNVIHSN